MSAKSSKKFSTVEIEGYTVLWVCGVLYSIYNVYLIGGFFRHDFHTEDFSPGWIFDRKKDVTDYEWHTWVPVMLDLIPWCVVNFFVAEICRSFVIEILPLWYITISCLYLHHFFGPLGIILIFIQPVIFHLIARTNKSKVLTWSTCLAILIFLNSIQWPEDWFQGAHHLMYMMSIVQFWTLLRCLSYCLDVQSGLAEASLLHFLAYCCYLPVCLLGPLVLYTGFRFSMDTPATPWTLNRISSALFGLLRYSFWFLVADMWIHFIYASALIFHPQVVNSLDSWTLYGMGYCLGQFFALKYIVVYGLFGTIANIEGIPAPPAPKCIGRIHLYSDMWKTFDRGLYQFLTSYIYIPLLEKRKSIFSRALASLACFAFVYVWHGTRLYIIIWAALNYLGVTIEMIARSLADTSGMKKLEVWLGPLGTRRFVALMTSPLLFMSALSNFYFFSDVKIGNIFVTRSIQGLCSSSLVVLLFLYCCCNFSEEWKRRENLKRGESEKNILS